MSGMRFQDKVVVVIGGNSGIGLASAKAFAQEGAQVVISGRDPATLATAAQQIGAGTLALRSDLGNLDDQAALFQAVAARHGRIDVLFINAGIGTFAPVRDVTPALWDQVHAINLRGAFFAAQKGLALMGRGGAIVFTGSIGSVLRSSSPARILACELVSEGIRVNVVSPGATETPLINRNVGMSAEAVDGLRAMMIANTPMKRMGEPEEIARAVLFLASSEASFITGVDLFVDGGVIEL